MASAVQKIKLSPSRNITFDKLVLSQSNVHHVELGISIDLLVASASWGSWKLRMFVPTGEAGSTLLAKVLERCPLSPISDQAEA